MASVGGSQPPAVGSNSTTATGSSGTGLDADGIQQPQSEPIPPDSQAGNGTAKKATTAPPAPADDTHADEEEEPIKRWHIWLGLQNISAGAVVFLVATTCIDWGVVRRGIVGRQGGLRPFDVMSLFLSFAYISISLDHTGLFRYLAFAVAERYASSGRRLYAALFIFFAASGCLVGNDPLILSGTPFLAYFVQHAGIEDPTAYLFSHFQVANLVSSLLVSSNPTNLVITSGFNITFLRYTAWTALPTLVPCFALYPLLRYGVFHKRGMIPRVLHAPRVDARKALVDPQGGIFGACLFLSVIAILLALSALDKLSSGFMGVWIVVAPAALTMLARDMVHDVRHRRQLLEAAAEQARLEAESTARRAEHRAQRAAAAAAAEADYDADAEDLGGDDSVAIVPVDTAPPSFKPLHWFAETFPTTWMTLSHLPLNLVVFGFSMFVNMEALLHTGWVALFARWWDAWVELTGIPGAVIMMGFLTVVFCNICGTNIGSTVLLTHIMQQWEYNHHPSPRHLYGALYAMTIGSSFGAFSFTFPASLAGLLWRTMLARKGIHISHRQFFKWNFVPILVTMSIGCAVVAIETHIIYNW
ncbi:hypothetical protein P8C59_005968 [Phyllachora maydis]|nr:hypothetical protein P8C59_005968 [Phyllachora maydis]